MLQTRLRQLLAEHGISPYRFAKTIEAQGERSKSWAYRSVRGEIGLTTEGIDLIIRCLRELTGKPIAVEDVMGYVEAEKPLDEGDEQAEEQVWELIFQGSAPQEEALPVLFTPPIRAFNVSRCSVPSYLTLTVARLVVGAALAGFRFRYRESTSLSILC